MSKELKDWLKENDRKVQSPSRVDYRQYLKRERELLNTPFKKDVTPEEVVQAQEDVADMQDAFLAKAYPGLDVGAMPVDIFRDLLVATIAKGQGNQEKN